MRALIIRTLLLVCVALAPGFASAQVRVLGAFAYTTNEAVLHTDASFLPRSARARASWNYRLGDEGKPTITYHLNRLQALDARRDYCVSRSAPMLAWIDLNALIRSSDELAR